ncbi:MAG: hypothetical protein WA002_00285, partial [Candidatus Acidiferrales bacterium]
DDTAVLEIRGVHSELVELRKRLESDDSAQPIRDAADALDKKMTAVEDELIERQVTASEDMLNYPPELSSKLAHLQASVDSADAAPTQQEYDLAGEFEKRVGEEVAEWNAIQSQDLVALNDLIGKGNIPAIGLTPMTAPPPAPAESDKN